VKELWVFTRQYPQGTSEVFLESAMPVWAKHFDKVRVIPMFEAPGQVHLPDGVEELRLWKGQDAFRPLSLLGSIRKTVHLIRLLRERGDARWRSVAQAREAIGHVRQLMRKVDILDGRLMPMYDPERVTMLCIWMEDWVTVLALLKQRHPALHFASMAHRWDLFADRREGGRIPFRDLQVRAVERVLCISEEGAGYLKASYPKAESRITTVNLGTIDHGKAPWTPNTTLRIVSCAYLRPPKRVDLLASALRHVTIPVLWTHFGDGEYRMELERMIAELPGNITVALKGTVGNAQVMQWYRENPVDLFVHLSDHEGVPVALMEAAGFGIPLMANKVGGVAEVVTASSGILLDPAPDPKEIAVQLERFSSSPQGNLSFRSTVRHFWEQHFHAEGNSRAILDRLMVPAIGPARGA